MPKTLISTLALAAVLATTALPALAHPPGGYGDLVEAVAPAVCFYRSDLDPGTRQRPTPRIGSSARV